MKNRFLHITLLAFACLFMFTGCNKELSDAKKFKQEYESLNNVNDNGKRVRSINIDINNPFVYVTEKDIINLIDKKETFVVYFGFAKCPWCRSVLPSLIDAANDLGIEKIYYVDIKDARDILKVDENKNIIKEKDGTKEYYLLIEKLNNVLSDYELTTPDGEKIVTGEKRIYAPNIVSIINGKAESLEDGISEKQIDAYMKLTDDMKKESYDLFKCSLKCIIDSKNFCNKGC